MCGLVGFFSSINYSESSVLLQRMSDAISHRGPDSAGSWVDAATGLHLAHRRLSIQDLSMSASQPMCSACGRYVIAFNGEIYNHLKVRNLLFQAGCSVAWRSHSDTETLVECFAFWGIEKTLKIIGGMFSIAIFDTQNKSLYLARDRMGEKPLYWGWQGETLLFCSEVKALKPHPAFKGNVDRDSLALLMRHNCIPAPYSIYSGISKLPPGSYIEIPLSDICKAKSSVPQCYWSIDSLGCGDNLESFPTSDESVIDKTEIILKSVIDDHMISDVPVGAFLSGGIDSSLVAALMQLSSVEKVKTFTIGFDDKGYNEAIHAKAVAAHLGTDHCELYVSPADARNIIPSLPDVYCEPFADSSQIPTYLVSKLASRSVKVCLSGDGADELFGGYNRYLMAKNVWSFLARFPSPIRRTLSSFFKGVPPTCWDQFFSLLSPVIPEKYQLRMIGEKFHKLASVMGEESEASFYRNLTSHWKNPGSLVLQSSEPKTLVSDSSSWSEEAGFLNNMMLLDAQTYLPDDIFVKVDRASMSNSLETRTPFVDHRLIKYALNLPMNYKIRGNEGKWILRQVLYRHVPSSLVDRPKMGFGIPLGDWLRGPLREWAESLINEPRIVSEGFFNPSLVSEVWKQHLSGKQNNQHLLWNILMFQSWHEMQ